MKEIERDEREIRDKIDMSYKKKKERQKRTNVKYVWLIHI